uniref:ATP synthase F0 subunit 8 n=1 Tax=Andrena striata TaxID=2572774 RepID=A0A4D6STT5_9HYME|nr:ATP synthase F0 subunit 8 [Andrena striata]
MPQMKPMMWMTMMLMSIMMIMSMIITNYFTTMETKTSTYNKKPKLIKWKW